MDQVFLDAVESTVVNGTIWAPNSGTPASAAARQTLVDRGRSLSY